MDSKKPTGWIVIGTGPLADAVRTTIAQDPDRYLPERWGINAVGYCPCCKENVHEAKTRETNFEVGYLGMQKRRVHPKLSDGFGCCCVPAHDFKKKARKKKARK